MSAIHMYVGGGSQENGIEGHCYMGYPSETDLKIRYGKTPK